MLDAAGLRRAMCAARAGPGFTSFWRHPQAKDGECYYVYGTQAFYVTRKLMERSVNESYKVTCRMPIDLYFNAIGPWPVVTSWLVEHVGVHHQGFPV